MARTSFLSIVLIVSSVFLCASAGEKTNVTDPIRRLEGHTKPVVALAFSADGKLLLSGDYGEVHLWELSTGQKLRQISHHRNSLEHLAFAEGNRTALATSRGGPVRLLSLEHDERAATTFQPWGFTIAIAADGSAVATLKSWDSGFAVWDIASKKIASEWRSEVNSVHAAALAPDRRFLAVSEMRPPVTGPTAEKPKDFVIHRWQAPGGPALASIGAEPEPIKLLAFSPDGRTLAAVAKDGPVKLWEMATGKLRFAFQPGDLVTSMRFSPDGRFLALANAYAQRQTEYGGGTWTGEWIDRIRIWDLVNQELVTPLGSHKRAISALAFSDDGNLLASGSHDATILFWDMNSVRQKSRIVSPQSDFETLWKELIGPDGAKAYRAMWSFTAVAKRAVPFLINRVEPIHEIDAKRTLHLLTGLNSDQFIARQKAMRELEELGVRAKPALRRMLAGNPSEELRRRAEQLLKLPEGPNTEPLRIMEVLEHIGSAEALEHLRTLANGVPDARLTQEALASVHRLLRRNR